MPAEKRIFIGDKSGMNLDAEQRFIPNGQTRERRNCTVTINGDQMAIINIPGNELIQHTLPTGSNAPIGTYDDKLNKYSYAFIWNSLSNHSIFRWGYDVSDNTTTELVQGEGLNFRFDKLITSVRVIGSRFLVWTDALNEIGCLDLDNYATLPSPLTSDDRHYLELYKIPCPTPPTVFFAWDAQRETNMLNRKLYKIRTRYLYEGNFRTHFSTISRCAIPALDYTLWTEYFNQSSNVLCIHIPQPEFDDVISIEVCIQQGNTDGTMENWELLTTIPYDSTLNGGADILFDGTQSPTVVDQTEALQPFSFLPKAPQCLEFLQNNSIVVGNFPENMDCQITPKVQFNSVYNAKPTNLPVAGLTATYTKNNTATTGTYINENFGIELSSSLTYDTITLSGTPAFSTDAGLVLVLPLVLTYTGTPPTGVTLVSPQTITVYMEMLNEDFGATTAETLVNLAKKLTTLINCTDTRSVGFGGIVAVWQSSGSGNTIRIIDGINARNAPYSITTRSDVTGVSPVALSVTSTYGAGVGRLRPLMTFKTLKQGATHSWYIQYEDAKGRRTPAIWIGDLFVDFAQALEYVTAKCFINHLAPADAVRYHILYGGQRTYQKFVQIWTLGVNGVGNRWDFTVFDSINDVIAIYTGTSLEYTYVQGDHCRVIGYEDGAGNVVYIAPVDCLIQTASATAVVVESAAIASAGVTTGSQVLVEVWRPQVEADPFCYEIGYTFEVDSSGYHVGNVATQTGSQAAIIDMADFGDVYYKYRFNADMDTATVPVAEQFMESQDFSDFYVSQVTNEGRTNAESPVEQQTFQRSTGMYYTQTYIADSNANGLSMVLGTSFKEYAYGFGGLQRFWARDWSLVAWFEDRVGIVGVNRELVLDQDGTQTYQTDAVLNSMNYYLYDGGISKDGASLAFNEGTAYWVDSKRARICRLANNGIFAISNYDIKKWVNQYLNIQTVYSDYRTLLGAFDKSNESYIMSYQAFKQYTGTTTTSPPVSSETVISGLTVAEVNEILAAINSGGAFIQIVSDVGYRYADGTAEATAIDEVTITFTLADSGGFPVGGSHTVYVESSRDTLVFHEPSNSWITFLDLPTEMVGSAGIDWVSFKKGSLYIHNKGELSDGTDNYNTFYGEVVETQVDVVFNAEPSKMKLWENIMQESSEAMNSDVDGDISNENGQESSLLAADYEELLPNQFSAPFLKDVNTPNATNALTTGDDLISPSLKVRLKTQSTSQVKLFAVTAFTTTSNL